MITEEQLIHILGEMDIHLDEDSLAATLEGDLGLDSAEITELTIAVGDAAGTTLPPRYFQKTDSLATLIVKVNRWITSGGQHESSLQSTI